MFVGATIRAFGEEPLNASQPPGHPSLCGTWKPWYLWNFAVNGVVAFAALWRIWPHLGPRARVFAASMPAMGLLSLPLAWILMERFKWALMAQVQPARSLLYTAFFAVILSVVAAMLAMRSRRWVEAALWWMPGLLTAVRGFLWDGQAVPMSDIQVVAAAVVAAMVAGWFATRSGERWPVFAALMIVSLPVLTGWMWKEVLHRANFQQAQSAELTATAQWARGNTAKDAMFLLPELTRSSESGIFRARAQRALFVDWKIGGQVNYSRDLSFEWWRRMQMADDKTRTLESWRSEGVDFLVLKAATAFGGGREVYRNSKYAVYAVR